MRSARACAVAVKVLAGCRHSSGPVSAPAAATGIDGSWNGYLSNYPGGGGLIQITLHATADSISGTGSWGAPYDIAGRQTDSTITFTATPSQGTWKGWSVTGVLSGNFITGTMTPNGTSYPVTFARQ